MFPTSLTLIPNRKLFAGPIRINLGIDEITNNMIWLQEVVVPRQFSPHLNVPYCLLLVFLPLVSDFDPMKDALSLGRYAFQTVSSFHLSVEDFSKNRCDKDRVGQGPESMKCSVTT